MELLTRRRLDPSEAHAVKELVAAVKAEDGVPPLSDQVLLHLTSEAFQVLAYDGSDLVGYAHLSDGAGEVAVHPAWRRRGIGRALVTALLAEPGPLRLWARAENPGAARLAASLGFTSTRVLRLMRRTGGTLPPAVLPDGVAVRPLRVGVDEEALLAVNNRAFAAHPEQGRWTLADVQLRTQEPWFRADGVFLAWRGDRLVGFHWTKTHPDGVGEVYVVGVDPSEQGSGLGKALTVIGVEHLLALGSSSVILYVDDDNAPAVAVYEKLGFVTETRDVSWSAAPSP